VDLQVNKQTNAKRPVRRWPSLQEKQSWEALQIQQAIFMESHTWIWLVATQIFFYVHPENWGS